MYIKSFISEWIRLSNAFDTDKYLEKYREDAVLDDPSVKKKFIGLDGIRNYFTSYFIGYKTQTRLVKMDIRINEAHLGGIFDITFKEGKIATVRADLI